MSRGRPMMQDADRKDRVLRVRLTTEELRQFSESIGERPMSEVVRQLIARHVREHARRSEGDAWRNW